MPTDLLEIKQDNLVMVQKNYPLKIVLSFYFIHMWVLYIVTWDFVTWFWDRECITRSLTIYRKFFYL